MSHRSASGFGFSVLVEIAAVIAIVAFLPRIDLRPKAQAAMAEASFDHPANVTIAAPAFTAPSAPAISHSAPASNVMANNAIANNAIANNAIAHNDITPVGWTPLDLKNGEATRAASYSDAPITIPRSSSPGSFSTNDFSTNNSPPSATSFYSPPAYTAQAPVTQSQSSPPIITTSPDPKFVENRLDRASQRLLNSVGSSLTSAANSILPPPATTSTAITTTQRPLAKTTPRAAPSSNLGQHRPWLRY